MKQFFMLITVCIITVNLNAQLQGNSLKLNTDASYISIPDATSASLNNTMTIESWVYYKCENGTSGNMIMSQGWCGSTWSFYFNIIDQRLRFNRVKPLTWNGSNCNTANTVSYMTDDQIIPFNTWTHVAVVIDGLTVLFYVNGQLVPNSVVSGTNTNPGFLNSTQPILIGASRSLSNFYGSLIGNLDDIRIWHAARTQSDIQSNMNTELTGTESGLFSYWKLNESGNGNGISVLNSVVGGSNGITVGSAVNTQFVNNNSIINSIPYCDEVLWLKADSGVITNVSNQVSQWTDLSGLNNHAIQNTNANKPILMSNVINGKPVIHFSTSTGFHMLNLPGINLSATPTVDLFVVYKINSGNIIFENSANLNASNTGFVLYDNPQACSGCGNGPSVSLLGNVGYNTIYGHKACDKYIVAEGLFDKSLGSNESSIRVNGFLNPPPITQPYNFNNTNNFGNNASYIGFRGAGAVDGAIPFDGDIAEMILFARAVSNNERAYLQNYLQNKYLAANNLGFNTLNLTPQFNTHLADDGTWKHSYNSSSTNAIIASIKDNCLDLGTRSDTVYVEPTAGLYNGQFYMRRHYTINTSLNPIGTKRVRIYYTDADFADLQSHIPSLQNHTDLVVTKYDGLNEDGTYDPTAGTTTFIPSSQITTGTLFGQHFLEFDVDGFSEFWIHTGMSPLPLDIISFVANQRENQAFLHWKTANSKNVGGFEIEKNYDGKNFKSIGYVMANTTEEYNFTDNQLTTGINSYRLKIVDLDGKYMYSKIIVLHNEERHTTSIYPNPVKTELHVVSTSSKYSVSIYNILGKEIIKSFSNEKTTSIDCSKLAPGIYFVQIKYGTTIENFKIMIE